MNSYNDGCYFPPKMETIGSLINFFQKSPLSQFSLYTLKKFFTGFDIHTKLVELEQQEVLIRSKININGKPVAHWQLNEKSFYSPLPIVGGIYRSIRNDYIPQQNAQYISNDSSKSVSWRKPTSVQLSNITIEKCAPPIKTIFQRSKSEEEQCDLYKAAPRRLMCMAISSSTSLSDSNTFPYKCAEKVSQLNPNSPIFIPSHEKSVEYLQRSDSPELSIVNNLSTEFMTALTKNPVSVLYEFAQQRGMNCEIDVLEIAGPSHKPKISMVVTLNGRKFDTIIATNKKEGKRLAADAAIRKLISEGHFAERISRLSTRAAFNEGDINNEEITAFKNSVSKLDNMASLVYNKLAKLLKDISEAEGKTLAGRKVVSALIMQDEKHDKFEVISLATGNRCISGDKISLTGKVVNDCHAEVIVRRSFMLFLYHQLLHHILDSSKSLNIFEDVISDTRFFKVKAYIKFHLYISTAPCGDSALFCNRENVYKKTESKMMLSKEHQPIFEHPVQGLLRSKIEGGEGTIPVNNSSQTFETQSLDGILRGERLKTMSCSDKIARWNYLGLQGALLSQFIDPIFLKSISLGNLYNAGHLSRAVCCRLDRDNLHQLNPLDNMNHPDLGYVHVGDLQREIDKSNELSLNWSYGLALEIVDGVTGQLTGRRNNQFFCSRISKSELFSKYFAVLRIMGRVSFNNNLSYMKAKLLSTKYENKKRKLFEMFHKLEYGSWIRKPVELNDFMNVDHY